MTYESDGFIALADVSRRQIFEKIARKPASVGELAKDLPISRPAVSQHLKVLKDAGLVQSTKQGIRNVYCIDFQGIAAIRDYLDRFWDNALVSFKQSVEEDK